MEHMEDMKASGKANSTGASTIVSTKASMEVMEAFMGVMEAFAEVMEASMELEITSMEA